MSPPDISVLMPVYNGEEFVANAIRSILDQDYTRFELIIVDDGSTDGTHTIIDGFSDHRMKLLQKDHSGIADSLNFGLRHCKGQLIARMDADDVSFPARLGIQSDYLQQNPAVGAVSCLVEYAKRDDLPDGYAHFVRWINELSDREKLKNKRFMESPFAHPSMMFRRNLIGRFGDYTLDKVPEDYELWLRWFEKGVIIDKLQLPLIVWNDRKKRLSRQHDNYSEAGFFKLKAIYFMKWYRREGGNRKVFIWGRGRIMRRRLAFFCDEGLVTEGYIDISKRSAKNCFHYKETDRYKDGIIICFVSDTIGKLQISEFLISENFEEGSDFFHVV
ncbi:MAG: glycosyltransferase [Cyclobacteriaceae bacterium]